MSENSRPLLEIVLLQPRIAANVGSIGRTCVALGAALTLVRPMGFHVEDRRLRRAGLDYWPSLRWRVVDSISEALAGGLGERSWLIENGPGAVDYLTARFRSGDVLIFGAEDRGAPETVISEFCAMGRMLEIPIAAEARSLNLANAMAIVAYEARRQILDGERQ
jgi:tRNA (cytidine/uridine-2'-O-)-methyltransferase